MVSHKVVGDYRNRDGCSDDGNYNYDVNGMKMQFTEAVQQVFFFLLIYLFVWSMTDCKLEEDDGAKAIRNLLPSVAVAVASAVTELVVEEVPTVFSLLLQLLFLLPFHSCFKNQEKRRKKKEEELEVKLKH